MLAEQVGTLTFNDANGFLDVFTTDFILDGTSWDVRITRTSKYSNAAQNGLNGPTGIIDYTISFLHKCWQATLTPPKFDDASLFYSLEEAQSFLFANMKSSENCGGITQELIYVSGPVVNPDLSTIYTLTDGQPGDKTLIQGVVNTNEWLGSYSLLIKGTNGQFDPSPFAFGNEGLFNTVNSSPILIKIDNPCVNSIVNFDNGFTIANPFEVEVGFTQKVINEKGPKDSASDEKGNGYDVCGPLQYSFSYLDFIKATNDKAFQINFNHNEDQADDVSMVLNSVPFGREIRREILMTIRLVQYPTSTPAEILTELVYRECLPTNFRGERVTD